MPNPERAALESSQQRLLANRRGLRAWFQTPLGVEFAKREQACLEKRLADLFGYHLIQLGCLGGPSWIHASPMPHRVIVDPDPDLQWDAAGLHTHLEQLPFANDSVDTVVIPHALEFSTDPHQLLREVMRVLVGEGNVVIIGFNPFSLFGLWRWVRLKKGIPWQGRFFNVIRVKDWLQLLGFQTLSVDYCFYELPTQSRICCYPCSSVLERLGPTWWPVLGGAFIILARKRVFRLTPIRPRWRPRRALITPGLIEPSRRSRVDG